MEISREPLPASSIPPLDRRLAKRMDAYWRKNFEKEVRHLGNLDVNGWFDLWHTHIDWRSKGNRHPSLRQQAARLTFELYRRLLLRIGDRRDPIQSWAMFHEDTGSNAVYLHSENPNRSNFPYAFEQVEWNVPPPPELAQIDLSTEFQLGEMHFQGERSFIIRPRVAVA